MSLDSPILSRQKILAFATETTTGTAATINAAAASLLNAFNPKILPTIPPTERRGQGVYPWLAPIAGARSGKCTFSSELFGSGSAATPPGWGIALLACGMQLNTATYTPLTGCQATLTMATFQGAGARYKSILGAMGDLTITAETGKPVQLSWDFLGPWSVPTTVSPVTMTNPTTQPPRFAGAAVTIGGVAYRFPKVEIKFNNKVELRKDPNPSSGTGYHAAFIVDRKITVKIPPESLPLGSQDWFAAHLAGTSYALSCTVGTVAGNQFILAAPGMQLLNPPQDEEDNGILRDGLEFLCVPSAGDDEFSIQCV